MLLILEGYKDRETRRHRAEAADAESPAAVRLRAALADDRRNLRRVLFLPGGRWYVLDRFSSDW